MLRAPPEMLRSDKLTTRARYVLHVKNSWNSLNKHLMFSAKLQDRTLSGAVAVHSVFSNMSAG
jgi:hypothetical protein